MSQSTGSQASSSTGRMALAIGIVGLVLGASGLGYAVYLGQSQIPSQLSSLAVSVTPSDKAIRVEWTTAFEATQDRFEPQYITVAQGDNLTIILITNDTIDAHTFTIGLALRGLPGSAQFVLNNSANGLTSGPFLTPMEVFTAGPGQSCSDRNGNTYACNTKQYGVFSGTNGFGNTVSGAPGYNITSTGWLGQVTVPGVYKFFCFYHQKGGMFGYLVVLPNKGYTP